ncbi:SlyX family protein [Halovulum sp. GXIMD14793]
MTDPDRITALEETVAHQAAAIDDLSDVVHRQSAEIDQLTRRVALLMQRAAEQEADAANAPPADSKPPHW